MTIKSRLNLFCGLLQIACGLLLGMLLTGESTGDIEILKNITFGEHITRTSQAEHMLELAHAHLGVFGILNLVLCLFLENRTIVQAGVAIGTSLVPIAFILWCFNKSLIYISMPGSAILLASIAAVLWSAFRKKI